MLIVLRFKSKSSVRGRMFWAYILPPGSRYFKPNSILDLENANVFLLDGLSVLHSEDDTATKVLLSLPSTVALVIKIRT